ncbi:MAG TPA: PGPGW domain-containing protein [Rhizomicrobium sp.]
MRKFFLLALGWVLVVVGLVLTPAPIPIPLLGVIPLLAGCAILSANSKSFRRALQRLRLRFSFISRWLDGVRYRMPSGVKTMIRRTNPRALLRLARLRLRRRTR